MTNSIELKSIEYYLKLAFFISYATLVICLNCSHAVWRDEVHALSLIKGLQSFTEIPRAIRNDGHPGLWYFCLYMAHLVIKSTLVLKMLNIFFCLAGVALLVFCSPLPLQLRLLFPLTHLVLFEYAVFARNYSISMFLLFTLAYLISKRWNCYSRKYRPILISLTIALLANTNVHSLSLSFLIVGYLAYHGHLQIRNWAGALSALILVSGLGLSIYTLFPDQQTPFSTNTILMPTSYAHSLLAQLENPLAPFKRVLLFKVSWLAIPTWLLLTFGLCVTWSAALMFNLAIFGLGTFFSVYYSGLLRHQGLMLCFLIFIYWIIASRRGRKYSPVFLPVQFVCVNLILPIMLLQHLLEGFSSRTYMELVRNIPCSSSRDLGDFLANHERYRDAILISEPDFQLESLPYYVNNRIFVAREGKFQPFVSVSKSNRNDLGLLDLLEMAKSIHSQENSVVLFVLGHSLKQPFALIHYGHDKIFSWQANALAQFKEQTEFIRSFRSASGDENYDLYVLRGSQ